MSSKARVDASLRVVHTSGPLALPPAGCHRLNSPRIGLWTSLCRSSWGLHMFFSPTLSAEGQGLATPTDTLPLTHEGHKHISCCVESVTLHIGTHISCIYCLCSKSLAFNWSRAMSTKLPYSVFPLICCTHARTHTHTHSQTQTQHIVFSLSLCSQLVAGHWSTTGEMLTLFEHLSAIPLHQQKACHKVYVQQSNCVCRAAFSKRQPLHHGS